MRCVTFHFFLGSTLSKSSICGLKSKDGHINRSWLRLRIAYTQYWMFVSLQLILYLGVIVHGAAWEKWKDEQWLKMGSHGDIYWLGMTNNSNFGKMETIFLTIAHCLILSRFRIFNQISKLFVQPFFLNKNSFFSAKSIFFGDTKPTAIQFYHHFFLFRMFVLRINHSK